MFDIDGRENSSLPITVCDLVYQVNQTRLVDVASLEISAGGPTMILGPNGAGKSLFLRLLHGLIEPSSGTILINGRTPDRAMRRQQAMVFQKPVLLRRSVAANIAYALKVHGVPAKDRKPQVEHLLHQSGLTDRSAQPARSLSGGEQQRLAVVRALASKPGVLFLDEPTSSLDPAASDTIENLISQAAKSGTKIIMITHDLGLAQRLAETILFFHKGRICEQTPGGNFFRAPKSADARAFLASKLALWGGEK